MKIALLGTGFGRAHAAVYAARDDIEVVMFGRDATKTATVAGQFGFACSTDMDTAFADDSFDLVDICLPIRLHAEYVLRALDAGKHALVELPLADNIADARRVAEAAAHSDKHVFVDMFERFIPANSALFDATSQGTYGRLEQLTLWNLTAHLWPGASLGRKVLPPWRPCTATWTSSRGPSACLRKSPSPRSSATRAPPPSMPPSASTGPPRAAPSLP